MSRRSANRRAAFAAINSARRVPRRRVDLGRPTRRRWPVERQRPRPPKTGSAVNRSRFLSPRWPEERARTPSRTPPLRAPSRPRRSLLERRPGSRRARRAAKVAETWGRKGSGPEDRSWGRCQPTPLAKFARRKNGSGGRIRTCDKRINSPLLYQLSYAGIWSGGRYPPAAGAATPRLRRRPGEKGNRGVAFAPEGRYAMSNQEVA